MQRLAPLLGRWEVDAIVDGRTVARARSTCEWLEGDAFIIQRTDVETLPVAPPPEWIANSPFPITTILGADDASDEFTMLYTDGRGVCRVCRMTLSDGVWRFWRDAPRFRQRFVGTFADAGRTIRATLEKSLDGSTWVHDFDQTYRRIG